MDGVSMVPARRLPSMLRELPVVLGLERVAALADRCPGQRLGLSALLSGSPADGCQ
jgi:hypothetical protein